MASADDKKLCLTSPADISKIMKRYGFAFSKSLGQNFLIDSHVVDSIIDAVEKCVMRSAEGSLREGDSPESSLPKSSLPKGSLPESGSAESKSAEGKSAEGVSAVGGSVAGGGRLGDVLIIEIGPGFGVLTERLCEMGARMGTKVVAIEKDKSLPPILRELVPAPNLEIIEGDVLACDLDTVIRGAGCERAVVVANLPYYITTPIIMKVLEDAKRVDALVVMMQKEVADRILDKGDRGAITMTAGYYAESVPVASIKRNSFMPAPKVDSAVLSMTRIPPRLEKAEEGMYMRLVRAIYSSRRKTLTNSLNSLNLCDKKSLSDVIIEIGYSPNLRGETLGIEDLLVLSKKFTALEER